MHSNVNLRNESLARVALHARSETRFFMIEVARRLKQHHGSSITLYVGNEQERAFYKKQAGEIFDDIVEAKMLHTAAVEAPAALAAEVERARAYEARIGQTINFLTVSNRHLGRGYSLGGFYHPRSRISENTNYVHLLHAYNESLAFWDGEISKRNLTLIINAPREATLMARDHGIPYRGWAGSRYQNFHYWAHNEYLENPLFSEGYGRGDGQDLPDLPFDRPYDNHLHNRKRFFKDVRAFPLMKRAALEIARYCWWRFRGYEKAKGYYLSENVRYLWNIWRDWRRLLRLAQVTLEDLKDQPFVYFPLHLEPETALQGLSPEYFFQLTAIASISRDLPAGVMLGVKEAYGAVGRRPADFYRQIAEFKNVVLLDPTIPGFECVRQAAATATICGTAGLEAAMLGKPVVTFGHHNIYKVLPHVRLVTDDSSLQQLLHEAIFSPGDAKANIREGQRFLKAVVANSFDMRKYDYFYPDQFMPESVVDACAALASGLESDAPARTQKQASL